jgi:hypothetical protein
MSLVSLKPRIGSRFGIDVDHGCWSQRCDRENYRHTHAHQAMENEICGFIRICVLITHTNQGNLIQIAKFKKSIMMNDSFLIY